MVAKVPQGLVIVNTGDGKGKTTAALGLAMRAVGHGLRVAFVQSSSARRRPSIGRPPTRPWGLCGSASTAAAMKWLWPTRS
jgi:hypothetical protein